MRITKDFTYALNIIHQIHTSEIGSVRCRDVAKNCNLSEHYVNNVMRKLKKSEILESKKGPGGGYKLIVPLSEISVKKLFDSVQEPFLQSGLVANDTDAVKVVFESLDAKLAVLGETPISQFF